MVIYKETVFTIILVIGLLAFIGLIMMRERRTIGNTIRLEESAKPLGIIGSVEDYLREHYLDA